MTFKKRIYSDGRFEMIDEQGRAFDPNDEALVAYLQTNVPQLVAGDEYVTIVNGEAIIDLDKANRELEKARIDRLNALHSALQTYIYSAFDAGTQASFLALYSLPATPSPVKDSIALVWSWIQTVLGYYYGQKAVIEIAVDPSGVSWDFAQFNATMPPITLRGLVTGA